MANKRYLNLLVRSTEAWNKWRELHPNIKPNLRGADLSGSSLHGVDFNQANFKRAILRKASFSLIIMNSRKVGGNFNRASFNWADLSEADLSGASLSGVDLSEANLSKVKLSGVDLSGANLSQANLNQADLSRVNLSGAILHRVNLSGADFSGLDLSGAILSDGYFSRADFRRANLIGAGLNGADLSEANLQGAILRQVNLCDANLSRANLRKVDFEDATLINADLRGAELNGATLVRTNLEKANLTGCSIYGISVWNVQLIDTNQLNLIITDEGEPTITVDNLEIAQFIYLLLEHKKIREVLNSVMERGVLLLGRFGDGGLELLQSVAEKLRDEKYLPMIFDFDRPDSRNYTETVKTLVGLSRFVIVDLSGPSVPQEPYSTIPHFKIPFVPIIEKRRRIYSMFPDLLEYPWVLKPVVEFENKEHSRDLLLPSVIKPAEEKFKERQALLQQLFHG